MRPEQRERIRATRRLPPRMLDRKVTIASFYEFPIRESRSYGTFIIPASDGVTPTLFEVHDVQEFFPVGDEREENIVITADEIAKDLVKDYWQEGVIVCEGDAPTQQELERALQFRTEFYQRMVFVADRLWENPDKRSDITDVHRRAAKNLGLTNREWVHAQNILPKECEACGSSIKAGIIKCPHCGAIHDWERAVQFGLVPAGTQVPEGAPKRVAPGKVDVGLEAKDLAKSVEEDEETLGLSSVEYDDIMKETESPEEQTAAEKRVAKLQEKLKGK